MSIRRLDFNERYAIIQGLIKSLYEDSYTTLELAMVTKNIKRISITEKELRYESKRK